MCFNTFANLTIIGGTVYMGKIEQHQNTSAKPVRVCLGWHPCCFQTTHGRLWGADVGCRPQPVPRRWASREGLPAFPNEATRQISAAQDSNPEDCQVSVTAISLQAWTSALWKNQIRHTLSFLFRTCWFSTRTMWADYFHLNVLETKAKNHERIEVPKALLVAHLSKDFTCNWAAYFIFFFSTYVLGLDLEMEYAYFEVSASLLQQEVLCLFATPPIKHGESANLFYQFQ